ncbi:hypothetical protein IHI24_000609 [Rickettsia endosymbiont of Cardiosporidium cionae]|nr:hypothetical protein IHI24_000609 [Rickettsia endosymbiont of Cardiosporidium cionae]
MVIIATITDGSVSGKYTLNNIIKANPTPIDVNITDLSVLNPNIVSNNTGTTIPV